jgi:hypothetical protein
MLVAKQASAILVAGMLGHKSRGHRHFEKSGDAFMPKIMKSKVTYVEPVTMAAPSSADRRRIERKDKLAHPWHGQYDCQCLVGQVAPDIVPNPLPRMLHVTDKDQLLLDTEVIPAEPADLSQTPTAKARRDDDLASGIF